MRELDREATTPHPSRLDPKVSEPGSARDPDSAGRVSALDAASILHLQRTAGNQGVVQMLAGEEPSPVLDVLGSGGSRLDDGTRSTMESAFGTSFEGVRVHTDQQASKSAESVGANAYTVGSDIVFRSGHFDPASPTGQRTLAHELAHVVQQSAGPVDGADAPGGIRLSDPSDRFERAAEATAGNVVGNMATATSTASAPSAGVAVQREVAPEEEELQTG